MEPKLLVQASFEVIGMEIRTTPRSPEIPALWGRFVPRMSEVGGVNELNVAYGVMGHRGHDMSKLDYLACVPVEPGSQIPSGMTRASIPAGTYAVFESSIATLPNTFEYIDSVWLREGKYQAAAGPFYERYGESFDPEDPNSLVTIHVPVIPKGSEVQTMASS